MESREYGDELKQIARDAFKAADTVTLEEIEKIVNRLIALSTKIKSEKEMAANPIKAGKETAFDYEHTRRFIMSVDEYTAEDEYVDCFVVASEFRIQFRNLFRSHKSRPHHFNREFLQIVTETFYDGNPIGFGKLLDVWEDVIQTASQKNVYGDFAMADRIRCFITCVICHALDTSRVLVEDIYQLYHGAFTVLFANCIGNNMTTDVFQNEFLKIANHVQGESIDISFEDLLGMWMDIEDESDNSSDHSEAESVESGDTESNDNHSGDKDPIRLDSFQTDWINTLIDTVMECKTEHPSMSTADIPDLFMTNFMEALTAVNLTPDQFKTEYIRLVGRDYTQKADIEFLLSTINKWIRLMHE
jgi:hypothetical protein